MAQLNSPGVSVTVVDESFYTPGAPGTVPLIIVASQENKQNSAGTGIAPGTLAANAGVPYLLTSQADLGSTFGIPYFETDASNNPVNAGELNEYGLQAAYSFLGVSNRAYVVRANLNTAQLEGEAIAPVGAPADGALWFDTTDTQFGIFEWDVTTSSFANQDVTVITDTTQCIGRNASGGPLNSIGVVGDYAIIVIGSTFYVWSKKYLTDTAAGTWVVVGSTEWAASWPTVTGTVSGAITSETFTLNGQTITSGTSISACAAAIMSAEISGITAAAINGFLQIYSTGVDVTIGGSHPEVVGLTAGNYLAPALQLSAHTVIPTFASYENPTYISGNPTGSVWVKTTSVNQGAHWFIKQYNAATGSFITLPASLYPTNQAASAALDPVGGGYNIPKGALYVKYHEYEGEEPLVADFAIHERLASGATSVTTIIIGTGTFTSGSNTFTIAESQPGTAELLSASVTFTAAGNSTDAATLAGAIQAASVTDTYITAVVNNNNTVTITHTAGGEIYFLDGTSNPINKMFDGPVANLYQSLNTSYDAVASLWSPYDSQLGITSGPTAPTTVPADQTLWYNTDISEVDIMIHDGYNWKGYMNANQDYAGVIPAFGGGSTDANGPLVSATQPTTQYNGSALANGDIWISTADLDKFPQIYVFNFNTKKWVLRDNADHTTGNGVVFHDARWSTAGANSDAASIVDLLSSNFLDFDAPDPALYPRGTLLWNLRRSGFNVKKYVENYVDVNENNVRNDNESMAEYFADRWVSDAANDTLGVGQFGAKAQRAVVLQALEALIQSNQQIRQPDTVIFNLLACPGYLETASSLVGLNTDNGTSAFIVLDAPAHLTPDATTLSNWGNNTAGAAVDGPVGLIENSAYSAVYYPWGLTTDLLGNNIVVPPSHIMLRTIALSDNVSYPWFAPAGVRRGGVTNASSVGYVDAQTGEYHTVALNQGQRDTLAAVHVNPITYIAGTGLVVYGQYTRQLVASSLDRINVARLVIYLRYQLNVIAKPFIFEPNDTITRNEIKQQIEKLLLQLTGERALYDYIVVCDKSNNTPARIDANELYVDIAIEPVKSVEFIYIPLRLENTGAIAGLSA